jgi:PAS domain S-box-containing protein
LTPSSVALRYNDGGQGTGPARLQVCAHDANAMSAGTDKKSYLQVPANMRRVLDAVSDGVMIVDKERRIVFLNRKARELLDYAEDDLLGCRCRDVLNTTDCENNCPLTKTAMRGCRVDGFEMLYRGRGDKRLQASSTFDVLRDDQGEIVGGVEVFRDLTEVRRLEAELLGRRGFGRLVGSCPSMRELYELIDEVAPTDVSVLVTGESGTGKELVARAIHETSARKEKTLVVVNCAALAEGVVESEFFGHVKGAFTGAVAGRPGRFELANGGTIFLDEIGELPPQVQAKLLRVIQEGEFEPVGSAQTRQVDVRVIAATNRDLEDAVEHGTFRRDLFYRLNVVPLHVPSLRDRREDLPELVEHFVRKFNQRMRGKFIDGLAPEALDLLFEHSFPGNVRELEHVVEHGFVRCRGKVIRLEHLPRYLTSSDRIRGDGARPQSDKERSDESLELLERDFLLRVLDENGWHFNEVAAQLNLSRTTLWRKLRRLGIEKPRRGRL